MCIIFASDSLANRPTMEELRLGQQQNNKGAGVAWIDKGEVRFKRSLKMNYTAINNIIQAVDGPVIVHFRLVSSGYPCDNLTHPFPLDISKIDSLDGTASGVFAHNGTLSEKEWMPLLLNTDLSQLPVGPWSDSRALAYIIGLNKNPNFLELFMDSNRFVTLQSSGEMFIWGNWTEMRDGLVSSCPLAKKSYYVNPGYGIIRNNATELTTEQWREHVLGQVADYEPKPLKGWAEESEDMTNCESWSESQWELWEEGAEIDVIEAACLDSVKGGVE